MINLKTVNERISRTIMLKSLESTLQPIFAQQVGISRGHWLNFTMRSTLMRSSLK